MEKYKNLSIEELKAKQKTLVMQNMGVGMAGSIAGVVYNVKTGGGFWRGVLFFIAGGFVVGFLPRMVYFIPQTNKINGLIKERENEAKKPVPEVKDKATKEFIPNTTPIKLPTNKYQSIYKPTKSIKV